jgi:hypothetical protein
MRIKSLLVVTFLLCAFSALPAQTTVEVSKAELSVPFGTIEGTAVLVGDYLVFIDERQVQSSFTIARSEIQNITTDGRGITIETRQPIQDRSGERSRFSFRFTGNDQDRVMKWSRMTLSQPDQAGNSTGRAETGFQGIEQLSFPAEYSRRFGRNSNGRLMVTGDMLAYESTDRVETSRRWQLKDIKQIKLNNPYEIEIEPFTGDTYNLRIRGQGIDNSEFQTIVDRITAARIAR